VSLNPAQARCTRYNIMLYSLSVTCDRSVVFSLNSGFFTNKTDRHDITEILLKVALNTINLFYFYRIILDMTLLQNQNIYFTKKKLPGPSPLPSSKSCLLIIWQKHSVNNYPTKLRFKVKFFWSDKNGVVDSKEFGNFVITFIPHFTNWSVLSGGSS
jgi:hypothetical protein